MTTTKTKPPTNEELDALVARAAMDGPLLTDVVALVAEVHRLRRRMGDWQRFIPEGAEALEAYQYRDQLIICGEPVDEPEEGPGSHSCDAMGCSSVSHVVYRGPMPQLT